MHVPLVLVLAASLPAIAGAPASCQRCPEGTYQESAGRTTCLLCGPGRFANLPASTRCASCESWPAPAGRAAFSSRRGSVECELCPPNALCERDGEGLRTGFTSAAGFSLLCGGAPGACALYRCPHGEGGACAARGRCHQGPWEEEPSMEGPLCGVCREGHGRGEWPLGLCERCPEPTAMLLSVLLNALIVLCFGAAMATYTTLIRDHSRPEDLRSAILKQFVNYLQMSSTAMSVAGFDLAVLDQLHAVMRYAQMATGIRSTALSSRSLLCAQRALLPAVPGYKVFTAAGFLFAPLLVLSLALLCWLASLCRGGRGRRASPLSGEFFQAFVAIELFLLLQRITQLNLLPFQCFHVDTSRHLMDTTIDCTTPDHKLWQWAGLCGFVCFSLGIPFTFFLILRFYQKRGRLSDPSVRCRFGFLYNGLELESYYFECVFMLRKVLFHALVDIPGHPYSKATLQCGLLLLAVGLFLLLQIYSAPFDNRGYCILDRIEKASLLSVFMTLLTRILLWSTDGSETLQRVPFLMDLRDRLSQALVLALHLYFLCLLLWGLCRGAVQRVSRGALARFLDMGEVEVGEEGLVLHGLRPRARELLEVMYQELVAAHVQTFGEVTHEGLATSLSRICVEATYIRAKRSYTSADPLKFASRALKEAAETLPVGSAAVQRAVERGEGALRRSLARISRASSGQAGGQGQRRGSLSMQIEEMREFSSRNIEEARGARFAVEELYEAMVVLGHRVVEELEGSSGGSSSSEGSPQGEEEGSGEGQRASDDDDDGQRASDESRRASDDGPGRGAESHREASRRAASRRGVSLFRRSRATERTTQRLEDRGVLTSELRAARQEYREEASAAFEEAAECRRQRAASHIACGVALGAREEAACAGASSGAPGPAALHAPALAEPSWLPGPPGQQPSRHRLRAQLLREELASARLELEALRTAAPPEEHLDVQRGLRDPALAAPAPAAPAAGAEGGAREGGAAGGSARSSARWRASRMTEGCLAALELARAARASEAAAAGQAEQRAPPPSAWSAPPSTRAEVLRSARSRQSASVTEADGGAGGAQQQPLRQRKSLDACRQVN